MRDTRGSYNRILVSTIGDGDDVYLDIAPKDMENALATGADVAIVWFNRNGENVNAGNYPLIEFVHTESGYVATFADIGVSAVLTYTAETENDRFKNVTEP